ncbi:hypothetical protein BD413DRAFT_65082 [Trametes elegans]|nr:hypothetical protein BD413DRAFT_65082 [Trametes elegans]
MNYDDLHVIYPSHLARACICCTVSPSPYISLSIPASVSRFAVCSPRSATRHRYLPHAHCASRPRFPSSATPVPPHHHEIPLSPRSRQRSYFAIRSSDTVSDTGFPHPAPHASSPISYTHVYAIAPGRLASYTSRSPFSCCLSLGFHPLLGIGHASAHSCCTIGICIHQCTTYLILTLPFPKYVRRRDVLRGRPWT